MEVARMSFTRKTKKEEGGEGVVGFRQKNIQ
jgi:hypothetical protein